jgi:Asp-tRNA(Asn)/Glu-tRNA(Gln) amidotransferase C subunit
MAESSQVTREQVEAIARAAQLDLPDDRLDQLVRMYNHFLDGFAKIREIDTGDREPPTLVPREEWRP